MRHADIAAVETDMAMVALASEGLEDLEALALLCLQRGLLDVEGAERVFGALGRVRAGLGVGRKWLRVVRYPGQGSGGAGGQRGRGAEERGRE
jgi:hypothetical protein